MAATARRLGPVDQLLADLTAEGGELCVEGERHGRLENLVSSAIRFDKVPPGKFLTVERGDTWSQQVVRLTDLPDWAHPANGTEDVRVKERLGRPQPAVKELRDDRDRLRMNKQLRVRALRILDALAVEAQERGFTVAVSSEGERRRGPVGILRFSRLGHDLEVDIVEQNDRVPHEPTAAELRDKERHSWTRIPTHDRVPSGRLEIQVRTGTRYGWSTVADSKTQRLEDRLASVLRELEMRVVLGEIQRKKREREEEERKRRWETAHEQAKIAAREQHRAEVLTAQVNDWHDARRLHEYLAAMAERLDGLSGTELEEARKWLTWAEARRDRLDPLSDPPRMPAEPEFTKDELAPHMRGFSSYGW